MSDKSSPKSETTSGTRGQAATAETTPKSSEPSHDGHKSPSAIKPPILPPERKDSHLSTNGDAPLPRIDAPGLLPTMSFSLSDPDFAVLLNEMETAEGSKNSPQKVRTPEATSAQASDGEDTMGSALSRSSNMNSLANAANGEAVTPSPSRTLLSPNDKPSPSPVNTLRRRGSKESIMSVRMEPDSSFQALAELVAGLKPDDDNKVSVDYSLLSEAIREHHVLKEAADTLKAKYTGAKVSPSSMISADKQRSSQQYSDGLVVAGEEYDKESQRRRELETEIARLRSQLHGQSARLSLISSDERRQERLNRRSQDLASNLTGLERDISRLRAQRDINLAEIEELQSKRGEIDSEEATSKVGRSLTRRLEKIKEEYRDELAPLSAQREALQREIADLEASKEQYIEEAASLQAKNDEISELNQQLIRQNESLNDRRSPAAFPTITKARGHPSGSPSMSSLATALEGVPEESKETARVIKVSKPEPIEVTPARRFKWIGKAAKAVDTDKLTVGGSGGDKRKLRPATEVGTREHHFTQHSTMRLGRCDLCQDKMWGLQEVKCSACGIVCHQKCAEKLPKSCTGKGVKVEDEGPLRESHLPTPLTSAPTMFGRDLCEQAGADNAAVPVIVTKCIRAVEANGMEYEGIYRKTGGNAQCKQITQLFERGKYETFDLTNADDFNDISAITSVLKNYFRNLPDPVFTHKLHESFIAAANIRGVDNKKQALCALLQELPKAHYDTLKVLMLHLNRVTAKSDINLMTSQNIGVVFGRESRSGIACCSSTDPSHPAPLGGPQPRVWRHGGQGAQRAVDGRERAVRVPRGARVDRLMRECVVRAAGP
jgi:cell division protein FtsB